MNTQKAVLTVSFGTSYARTRQLTIDSIEESIQKKVSSFDDTFSFYHAWTSRIILKKIREQDHLIIPTVREAFEQMKADGIRQVFVQPTHILPGVENEQMVRDAMLYASDFDTIRFGNPLLVSSADQHRFIRLFAGGFAELSETEAVVLMGHGTEHFCNTAYAALDYEFKDLGFPNFFVGTVEAYPGLESVIRSLKQTPVSSLILMPLMIVAGDHAQNDMAGSSPDSWENRLKAEGYSVSSRLQGLGELPFVREMFADHLISVIR